MNKRDVIILAVLLNTGLLSALAMVAIHTDDQSFVDPAKINQIMVDDDSITKQEKEEMIAANLVATDEWDSVLKDYVTSTSTHLNLDDNIDEFEKEFEEPKKIVKEAVKKQVHKEVSKEAIKPVVKESVKEVVKPVVKESAVKLIAKETRGVGKTIEITVKKGDALEKIARANGTSVEQVRALNNLKNDRLTIGQVLFVPVGSDKSEVAAVPVLAAPKAVSKANDSSDEVEYYIIKSGDNPWKIAKQFKVKFDDLLKMNHLDEEKARNLKIGDRIRVK